MSEYIPGTVETPWKPQLTPCIRWMLSAWQTVSLRFNLSEDQAATGTLRHPSARITQSSTTAASGSRLRSSEKAATDGEELLATPSGWVCRRCTYRQYWAHAWMTDWSWQVPAPFMVADAFGGTHDPAQ